LLVAVGRHPDGLLVEVDCRDTGLMWMSSA
jgi:hypothetical protein